MKTDHRNRLQSLSLTWENMQRATAMQFATKMKIRQQWDVLYKLIHNLSLTSHPSEPIRYQTEVMQYMTIAWEEGMDASIEIPPLPRYHLFGWVHNDPNLYQRYQFQVFPMKYKSDAPNTLIQFMQDVRNPCVLYGATMKKNLPRAGCQKFELTPPKARPILNGKWKLNLADRELKKAKLLDIGTTNQMHEIDCGTILPSIKLKWET